MRTPELTLYEFPAPNLPYLESYSPFCLKVHRALSVCGFPYERRFADRPGPLRHLNPAAQFPILVVNGEPVADSTNIVSRLDYLSGNALSRGLDARARAEAYLYEELADTALNGFVVAARWADEENWPRTRAAYFETLPVFLRAFVPERVRARVGKALYARDVIRPNLDACWSRFEEILDRLESRAPMSGFWLGEAVTRADIALFAQLFSLKTDLTPRQAESVSARSRLSSWMRRVDEATALATPVESGVHPVATAASADAAPPLVPARLLMAIA